MPGPRHLQVRAGRASQAWSTDRALWLYLLTLCAFTIVMVVTFDYLELHSPAYTAERTVATVSTVVASGSSQLTSLGFPYPQLARVRQLLPRVVADQHMNIVQLRQAYALAVHKVLQQADLSADSKDAGVDSASTSPQTLEFLKEATGLLASAQGLLQCQQDQTLLEAWHNAAKSEGGDQRTLAAQHNSSSINNRTYLLAANFHNSAAVLPNFIVQTLRLSVLLPPGQLAVSVYESGSSDTSRMWITLLHYLLLPLHVPHNITTAGRLSPHLGLARIQLLAQLRNALTEPWVTGQQQQQQQQQQQEQQEQQQLTDHKHVQQPVLRQLLRFTNTAVAGSRNSRTQQKSLSAGAAELSCCIDGFTPDHLMFVNDVFFCAEDVLRLMMHDADMACGMDFYTAPWQQRNTPTPPPAAAGGSKSDKTVHSQSQEDTLNADWSAAAAAVTDEDDDDFLDPGHHQPVQQSSGPQQTTTTTAVSSKPASPGSTAGGGLRFYDKWVSRDISGHRLVNKPPFIKHHTASAQHLAAGLPVPLRCCWNGLVVLAAAAVVDAGVRFRSHQAGECAGSECSLLCEDYQRLGFSHVVMDPGVRVTYELEQVDMLRGTAAAAAAAAAGGGVVIDHDDPVSSSRNTSGAAAEALGPLLSWRDVAARSVQLAVEARQRNDELQDACRQQQQQQQGQGQMTAPAGNCSLHMECCNLQPGRSYVDFRRDCHMVDIMAVNYTARAFQAATAAVAA